MSVAGGPQLPFDPFAKDLEQGDAEAAAAAVVAAVATTQEGQAGAGGGPIGGPCEWWYWVPCAGGIQFTCLPVRHESSGAVGAVPPLGPGSEPYVITFVKPYSAEVWVYRCRVAAVLSALILLTALIVAVVVIRSTNA